MRKIFLLLTALTTLVCWAKDFGYQNPVICGYHPDPSVCRVGDDYYLVNSSFEHFPGVPIFHSKDMIHWQQIGHVLTRDSQLPVQQAKSSDGIYAPSLRYHDGLFYMITTRLGASEHHNFYVTAKDPKGPWSEPISVDQSGIDPDIFWDEDGKVYFQSNRGLSWADPRAIYQSQIDINTGERLTEPKQLWAGDGGKYVEASHIYKRNGYYYLMVAEGGTEYNHHVTIARSRSVWGPFESCPHNPILSNVNSYDKIQGTGHADMLEAHDGSWWMVFLCIRPVTNKIHILGRETGLVPVKWENDWPVVNEIGQAMTDMQVKTLPQKPFKKGAAKDDFSSKELAYQWNYIRNPNAEMYSLTERKGSLTLMGDEQNLSAPVGAMTYLGQRIDSWYFTATTTMDFAPKHNNEQAGLAIYSRSEYHYSLYIKNEGRAKTLVLAYNVGEIHHIQAEIPVESDQIQLRVKGNKAMYEFYYAEAGSDQFILLDQVNSTFMGSEVCGGFTGPYVGMFATGNGTKSSSPAYFDWFEYTAE